MCMLSNFSCFSLCDWWTVAHQAPLFMGFSRPEYWTRLLFSTPFSPITSWQTEEGKKWKEWQTFFFPIGLQNHCPCEWWLQSWNLNHLFLRRKTMTNLDSILKNKNITLPTKVHIVKVIVFPVVMYRCESWTIKKAEHWRTDAFELWCCRRLLRVPGTARRSKQSILKEINPEYSLEGLMLKLKL